MDFGEDEEVRPPPPPRMAHPIGPRRPSTAALTAAHRAHLDAALPVRNGAIAQSSFSRDAIRTVCMQSLAESHNFTALYQAPTIAPAFSESKVRGRQLGVGQLMGGLKLVNAKVRTSSFRKHTAPLQPVMRVGGEALSDWDEEQDEEPEGLSQKGVVEKY